MESSCACFEKKTSNSCYVIIFSLLGFQSQKQFAAHKDIK